MLSLVRRTGQHDLRFERNLPGSSGLDVRHPDLSVGGVEQLAVGQPRGGKRKYVVERRDLLAKDSELAVVVLEVGVRNQRSIWRPRRGIDPGRRVARIGRASCRERV